MINITTDRLINLKHEARQHSFDDSEFPKLLHHKYIALLVKEIGARTFVELGTDSGGCAREVAMMNPTVMIHTIDTVRQPTIDSLQMPNIAFHLMDSLRAANDLGPSFKPIDVLFMDTSYGEIQIFEEFYRWLPYIRSGGLICMGNPNSIGDKYYILPGPKTQLGDLDELNPHTPNGGFGVIKSNNIDISILIPSINFDGLLETIKSINDTAAFPDKIEYLIKMGVHDTKSLARIVELPPLNIQLLINHEVGGYEALYRYYNELAKMASGDWLFVFNDDAMMLTPGWDSIVRNNNPNEVCLLNTQNTSWCQFPVLSLAGYKEFGCVSRWHVVDAWLKGQFQDIHGAGASTYHTRNCEAIKINHLKYPGY